MRYVNASQLCVSPRNSSERVVSTRTSYVVLSLATQASVLCKHGQTIMSPELEAINASGNVSSSPLSTEQATYLETVPSACGGVGLVTPPVLVFYLACLPSAPSQFSLVLSFSSIPFTSLFLLLYPLLFLLLSFYYPIFLTISHYI